MLSAILIHTLTDLYTTYTCMNFIFTRWILRIEFFIYYFWWYKVVETYDKFICYKHKYNHENVL